MALGRAVDVLIVLGGNIGRQAVKSPIEFVQSIVEGGMVVGPIRAQCAKPPPALGFPPATPPMGREQSFRRELRPRSS
jgi:hypothetical protein